MNTLKIRILDSLVGNDPNGGESFSYGKGFEGDVPAERAKELVRSGHAVLLETAPAIETAMQKPTYEKRKK